MSESPPDVKSSTTIHEGRIFSVAVDLVAYPDGRIVRMEVVRHPGSVVLLPMPAPDRIILVRQYRYVVDRWLWELPAGSRDPGESLDAAAIRECHEEVGKIAGRARPIGTFYPSPGFCDEAMNFFLLTELRERRSDEATAHQDDDELLTAKEFSIAEVRDMVRAGTIVDMKTVVGLTLISDVSGVREEG